MGSGQVYTSGGNWTLKASHEGSHSGEASRNSGQKIRDSQISGRERGVIILAGTTPCNLPA